MSRRGETRCQEILPKTSVKWMFALRTFDTADNVPKAPFSMLALHARRLRAVLRR